MIAVLIAKPKELVVREIPAPHPGPYEALVRMELCAICNATDTKLKDGHFPGFTTYPTTLGHEGIGTVVETGAKVVSFKPGDRVLNPCAMQTGVPGLASGWGTMAEFALAGDHAAMAADGVCDAAHGWDGVFQTQKVIPADIPSRQAILLSTWREVWSSFSDFSFKPGQSVFVFGGGPVGLSFVRLAKCFGMGRVCLATHSRWKLNKALALGANEVFSATEEVTQQVKQAVPDLFDVAVDAVGSPGVINQALQLVKCSGVIGVYGTVPEMQLSLDKSHAPYNWKLVMHQWPDYALEAAAHEPLCSLIRAGRISSRDYITHEFSFEEIEKGFAALRDNQALKVILHFPHPV